MRVIDHALCWGYPQDPAFFWGFERFVDQPTASNFVLAPGVFAWGHLRGPDGWLRDERVVYLCLEEPNGFFLPKSHSCYDYEDRLQRILTICPYTAAWGNARLGKELRKPVFFPTNEELIPSSPVQKDIPIIYTGNIAVGGEVGLYIQTARHFAGCTVGYDATNQLITHGNITYHQKLELISRSKIDIVHNLLFFSGSHMNMIKDHPGELLAKNKAFEHAYTKGIAPQLKSRTFEAAFCRSLILCRRDPWNLIETWFTPGEEFIYFDPGTLDQTIKDILANYDTYQPMIERAYVRAMNNYTSKHFFEKYLKDE